MKGKQLLIAVLALGLLGSIAYFNSNETLGDDASDKAGIGKTLVTDLDPEKITTIAITDNDATLTLAQKDEKWTVTERDGFAAKFDDIQKLVTSAVSLKSLRQIRASKKQHGRFELLDPAESDENTGTRVEFKDAQGQVLKSLLLGKKGSANSGVNAGSPFGSSDNQRYVLADGKVTVVAIDYSSALNDVSADPSDWLSKDDFFKVEKIKSITITQPNEADSWTLTRIKEGDDMALSDAKPDEKLDSSKGSSAGRVLGSPSFDDIASKSAKPEDTGMDKAVTATIDTFEGYNYVVKMAKKDNEYYMSLAASGTRLAQADETAPRTPQPDESKPRAQAKDEKPEDAERLDKEHNAALAKLIAENEKTHAESQAKLREERDKTFADNLAKLAKLEGWTFKVSSYTLDAIYKTRAEMMEEEKEEAAQGAATPPPILPALPGIPTPPTPPTPAPTPAPITVQPPKPADPNKVVTSDIIKVPSAAEMKKGAKIEVIKKEDLEDEIEKTKEQPEKKADDKE
ncbi:MAG: DUF4340 domain-containing protein [Verrucomicrobia bacterium]|nr:DUF4340 domain-containing protein [Verrucomicrobiota bacterium]